LNAGNPQGGTGTICAPGCTLAGGCTSTTTCVLDFDVSGIQQQDVCLLDTAPCAP
jgi:hypothetical protein